MHQVKSVIVETDLFGWLGWVGWVNDVPVVPKNKALDVDSVVPKENQQVGGHVEIDSPTAEGLGFEVNSTMQQPEQYQDRLPVVIHVRPNKCEDATHPPDRRGLVKFPDICERL